MNPPTKYSTRTCAALSLTAITCLSASANSPPAQPEPQVDDDGTEDQNRYCVEKFCRPGPDDDDGISYHDELAIGTDPSTTDSDWDGLGDLEEVGDLGVPSDVDGDGKASRIAFYHTQVTTFCESTAPGLGPFANAMAHRATDDC